MTDTRARLLAAATETLRTSGIAGTSARAVAATAGVNQALIFYHFGSVDDLLAAACRHTTEERVASYRERFAAVRTLRELLALGRALHAEERAEGNVAALAQLLAGAQTDARLAPATAAALNLWVREIEPVLHRLLAGSPLAAVMDVPGLARAVSAAFVGLELYEGVDPEGATHALDALDQLAVLMEVAEDLGPVARRALRSRLRQATS